jgi:hypothetical protein
VPPPTADLAKCRLILQILAGGLLVLSLFAIIAGQLFFIFYALIMAYMLQISWATFDYGMVLYFFLFSCLEIIMVYVEVIGMYAIS